MRYKIILLLLFFLVTLTGFSKHIPVTELAAAGKLTYTLTSTGTYSGYSLDLKLKNRTSDTLWYMIEPGRVMLSPDTNQQNLLVVKAVQEYLAPLATGEIALYAFCCESSDRAPLSGLSFKIGPISPPSWIKLAQLVNVSDFPVESIQAAVWVLSDNHPISSVTSTPASKSAELRNLLATLKGEEAPWYMLSFEQDSTLFSGRHSELMADLEFNLRSHGVVSIVIRNSQGRVMTVPERGRALNQGNHKVALNVPVANWPKGDYDLFIYQDQNLNSRRSFRL